MASAVNPDDRNYESTVPLLKASATNKLVRLNNNSDRRHQSIVRPLPAVDESFDESSSDVVDRSASQSNNNSPDIAVDVPSPDESQCQQPNTPATATPQPVTTGRRQTKFTVINYGAADALLSMSRSNEEDDDETDDGTTVAAASRSRSPSSTGIPIRLASPGARVRSGFIRDELPHHVRFRSSIAIADDVAAAGGGGARFKPLTIRQVSVEGGRVLVTTPLNFAIVSPPRLPTPPIRPSTAAASSMCQPLSTPPSNAISSQSSVELVLPSSRSPLTNNWNGDASAAERGDAGELVSIGGLSDKADESKTSATCELGGRASGFWSTTSKWRWSGPQMVSSSVSLSSLRWPPIDCEKLDDNTKLPTATASIGVFSDVASSTVDGLDDGLHDVVNVTKMKEVAKRGRLFAKRCKRRLVLQSGECNVSYVNVERRGARFLRDIFTTLLEMKWRYSIVVYLVTFILTWVLFALLWWLLHFFHGADENGVTCVVGVDGFVTAFLFSVETQHTIGYGSRSITDRCSLAVFLLMSQSLFGAVTQCLVTGVIFAKMSRPKGRAETIIFSRKAVVYRNADDGVMYLSFRVGDLRESQLIGVSINALLVRKQRIHCQGSGGGQHINLVQQRLRISTESDDDLYFLAWPIKLVHRIDETSPLWEMSSEQLLVADFELLVVLEANCEATGSTVQVRTSYLPSDILWGHTLAPLFTYQKENGRFKVDFSQFNNVVEVDMLEMSAKDAAATMLPNTNPSSKANSDNKTSNVNDHPPPVTSFHYVSDT